MYKIYYLSIYAYLYFEVLFSCFVQNMKEFQILITPVIVTYGLFKHRPRRVH